MLLRETLEKMSRKFLCEIHEASGQGCTSHEYELEQDKRYVTVRKFIGLLWAGGGTRKSWMTLVQTITLNLTCVEED
jgi:hypothetical protein